MLKEERRYGGGITDDCMFAYIGGGIVVGGIMRRVMEEELRSKMQRMVTRQRHCRCNVSRAYLAAQSSRQRGCAVNI